MAKEKIPRSRRLQTLIDIRRMLMGVINDFNQSKIDREKSHELAYLLKIMAGVIQESDLEERINALEDK